MRKASVIVAHDTGISGGWLSEHFPQYDGPAVKQIVDSLSLDSDALRSADADMLVIGCGGDSDEALELVRWWTSQRPGRPVVVLCTTSPNGFVHQAFSAGADDLVVLEPGPEISADSVRNVGFALQKALARRVNSADRESSLGTTICMLGPKGGTGKSVTSCNLALSLAMMHKRVVLVDLDLQFGDVALLLGLRPEATIYDLTVSGGSLDVDKVEAYLTGHPTGLRVLAAPVRPDQADVVTVEFITDVLATLRSAYDYVVIDTPPSFSPSVITSIDTSTYVCMVGVLDAVSLKNTRLGLETLELMGYPEERVRVVLNRANSNVGITDRDVVSILGRAPEILVPSTREVTRSVNEGRPIVISQPRSEAARAFKSLGELFAPASPERSRRARNWRSPLRRRSS